MKQVIIFGAGAIGTIFGGFLTKKHPVLFIGRKQQIETVHANLLPLGSSLRKKVTFSTATKLQKVLPDTIIFLTVKAPDTKKAILQIKKYLQKDTIIVCLQNGFGTEDIVRTSVACKVLRAVTYVGVQREDNGRIRLNGIGMTYIEKGGEAIADMLSDVGLSTEVPVDFEKKLWEKLMLNCVANGLGTVLQVRNNKLVDRSLEPVKKQIIKECVDVARKEGVVIDGRILHTINTFLKKSTNTNSTLQDIRRHKKTEIDFLNGAIVRLGKKYHVATPVNEGVYSIIRFRQSQ